MEFFKKLKHWHNRKNEKPMHFDQLFISTVIALLAFFVSYHAYGHMKRYDISQRNNASYFEPLSISVTMPDSIDAAIETPAGKAPMIKHQSVIVTAVSGGMKTVRLVFFRDGKTEKVIKNNAFETADRSKDSRLTSIFTGVEQPLYEEESDAFYSHFFVVAESYDEKTSITLVVSEYVKSDPITGEYETRIYDELDVIQTTSDNLPVYDRACLKDLKLLKAEIDQ